MDGRLRSARRRDARLVYKASPIEAPRGLGRNDCFLDFYTCFFVVVCFRFCARAHKLNSRHTGIDAPIFELQHSQTAFTLPLCHIATPRLAFLPCKLWPTFACLLTFLNTGDSRDAQKIRPNRSLSGADFCFIYVLNRK